VLNASNAVASIALPPGVEAFPVMRFVTVTQDGAFVTAWER
jgi:hypothetical protein